MEEEWIDITAVGSQYEEQLEIHSDRRRYRQIKMGTQHPFEEKGVGEWKSGSPPNEQK